MLRLRSNSAAERATSGGGGAAELSEGACIAGRAAAGRAPFETAIAVAGSPLWSDAYMNANPTARPDRPTNTRLFRTASGRSIPAKRPGQRLNQHHASSPDRPADAGSP